MARIRPDRGLRDAGSLRAKPRTRKREGEGREKRKRGEEGGGGGDGGGIGSSLFVYMTPNCGEDGGRTNECLIKRDLRW